MVTSSIMPTGNPSQVRAMSAGARADGRQAAAASNGDDRIVKSACAFSYECRRVEREEDKSSRAARESGETSGARSCGQLIGLPVKPAVNDEGEIPRAEQRFATR